MDIEITPANTIPRIMPGLIAASAATVLSWGIHILVPAMPLLTLTVALGILVGQVRPLQPAIDGPWAPGLSFAAKSLMRVGIVLLGLKLSLVDIAGLGVVGILTTVGVVVFAFLGTLLLGRLFQLPGQQSLLIATGFAICGASAIGAMSGVVRAKKEDTATAVALVTLCGTLAIAVLPLFWHPLNMTNLQFGHWVGAGVHDVGQVVATASIAGPAALAVAVVVKLTRVLMLAPIVAVASVIERRKAIEPELGRKRPPLVPMFIAGFIATVLIRTFVPLSAEIISAADTAQTVVLGMALFGLGSAVHLRSLVATGWRALVVGLVGWGLIAVLAYGAVQL